MADEEAGTRGVVGSAAARELGGVGFGAPLAVDPRLAAAEDEAAGVVEAAVGVQELGLDRTERGSSSRAADERLQPSRQQDVSLLRKRTYSPRARAAPWLQAGPKPVFSSLRTTRNRGPSARPG